MTMNPSSSSSMAPVLADYHNRATNLRSKILKNEEQRLQLEQKLRSMSSQSSRSYQRKQIQYIQNYFTRLNEESQRAEQRNLQLLNDLSHAQHHLDRLHLDAEHLTQLKNDYLTYLESNYPNWQKPSTIRSSAQISSSNEYDRLVQHMKQNRGQLENNENLRQSDALLVQQSFDVNSSMLFKRYEDQLKIGLERTISPSTPVINNENKDEQSLSESNDMSNAFSHAKRSSSLRMELSRTGLYALLDFLERQFKDTLDKKKFYRLDPPTIAQKRTIIDLANDQDKIALQDQDSATISMVILDQLTSTIRRTTLNQCLLTEDILSANIQDLDKDAIAQMLPEQDRSLWSRLIEHFLQLLRLHIMDAQTLANKFTLALVPMNALYAHEKAKSLLKHILDKLLRAHSSSSENEPGDDRKQPIGQTNAKGSSSRLKKLANGSAYDDYDQSSTSSSSSTTPTKQNSRSARSPSITPRKSRQTQANTDDDDAAEYFFT
ncbi:unnamed protein product [Adineta ricciae]|uniref:Centrosomal protein kizuna n=1 Tax=Adineta ricciae TaxID=249248 RepID=A0A814MYF8_ADIRI|nr:unnamed protein product [Adineta ricciae]